jgi:1,4-dihydroxy-2-naphthoate octaprenyltransferase
MGDIYVGLIGGLIAVVWIFFINATANDTFYLVERKVYRNEAGMFLEDVQCVR